MVKSRGKDITLNDLANMVAGGFDDIEKRMVTKDEFHSFNGEFYSLAKKVDKLDYQMDEVYDILKRFEENDILNLQKRVQILEKAVRSLASQSQR